MNRAAQVTMFALALAANGCARGRSALPPDPSRVRELGPIEITPVEPIRTSINAGKIPADLGTVRASYEVEAAAPAAPPVEPVAPAPPQVEAATPMPVEAVAPAPEPVEPVATEAEDPPAAPRAKPEDRPKPDDRPRTPVPDPGMTIRADADIAPGTLATKTVAVVGDTIITGRQLYTAMCQRFNMKPGELMQMPKQERGAAAKSTLDSLIEYTMIVQDERRGVKKIQQWNSFADFIDKDWKEKELPTLLRKMGADDEFTLRGKLEAQGESLDDLKDAWKLQHMSTNLLMMRVQPKVKKPGLPDLEAYYAEHRNDPSFHRDAKVHWREILVPVAESKDLPAARKAALALRARLVAGEDFAKLAKASSAGVTAAQGGAWVTAEDGSAVAGVNEALGKLAPGQISQPIEGPKGIYVIRVEKRTKAGPAPFVEVQRKIAEALFDERFHKAIEVHLKELRKRTSVSSPLFDAAPAVAEEKAKTDAQAKPASVR